MIKTLKVSSFVVAIAAALYHIGFQLFGGLGSSEHNILHVLLALLIVTLQSSINKFGGYRRVLLLLLSLLGTSSLVYVFLRAEFLQLRAGMFLSNTHLIIGAFILTYLIVLTWIHWGRIIASITILAIIYFFFGSPLPGALGFPHMQPWYVMSFLGMGIGTGLFGFLTPASSSMIFYLMLFSGVLAATGVLPMFLEVGKWLGQKVGGGAALTALVGSSLVGTVTGASVANVALTGTYTIPTMKRQGFKPTHAVAIEGVSSSGGQIMPPVMGAGAFVMASLTGTPYFVIMVSAIVPALLYYFAALMGVITLVRRDRIQKTTETIDFSLIKNTLPAFVLPLGLLVFLLATAHSVAWSTLWAMAGTIVVSLFNKKTRPKFKDFVRHFAKGAVDGAEIGVAIFAIALVCQTAITTGLGPRISEIIFSISGGILPISLILVMLGSLILGMGMTTVAAYIIVAIVMVPTLNHMGIERLAAHFFAFYFAVFSALTPPIATAALVGSQIAKANFWSSGWESFKLSIPLYLIPFGFVALPGILKFPHFKIADILMIIVLIASSLCLAAALHNQLLVKLNKVEMLTFIVSSILFAIYIIVLQSDLLLVAGFVFMIASLSLNFLRWRNFRLQAQEAEASSTS
ncbi:TRAP transporter permease [Chloroflexota bacterium]